MGSQLPGHAIISHEDGQTDYVKEVGRYNWCLDEVIYFFLREFPSLLLSL